MNSKLYVAKSGMYDLMLVLETQCTHYLFLLKEENGKTAVKKEEMFPGRRAKLYIGEIDAEDFDATCAVLLKTIPEARLKVGPRWVLSAVDRLEQEGLLSTDETDKCRFNIVQLCDALSKS